MCFSYTGFPALDCGKKKKRILRRYGLVPLGNARQVFCLNWIEKRNNMVAKRAAEEPGE